MRRFYLQREVDVSGVSGTGIVAEGIEFDPGGAVVLHWTSKVPSIEIFYIDGIESTERIHGHEGSTKVEFIDE